MAKRKKKMEESVPKNVINEPRIFELMYLEKSIKEAGLQAALQGKTYDERINQLQHEKRNIVKQWEVQQKRAMRRLTEAQREIEEKHQINMFEWGYDDTTGVIVKHPPDVLAEVHKQRENKRQAEQKRDEDIAGSADEKAPVAQA